MKKGQTLVALLVVVSMAITLAVSTVLISLTNSLMATKVQQSELAYYVAESGIENALLRLLRNPNYVGETLPVGEGTATISITTNPKTIISVGQVGNFIRKIKVLYESGDTLNILKWIEVQ